MLSAPDIKYTDRDVRENRVLLTIAEEYVKSYGGEFDPLVRAHNMLEMDGGLTIAMARIVLNCMRHSVPDLPEPKGYVMPAFTPRRREPREEVKEARNPRILYVNAHWRNDDELRLKARFKLDYIINIHMLAKWYHKVDHSTAVLAFYPADWWDERVRNSFRFQELRGMCGQDLKRRIGITCYLGDLEDAEESGLQFCPKCARRDH